MSEFHITNNICPIIIDNKELLIELFHKVIYNQRCYDYFCKGDNDLVNYNPIYEWWSSYLNENVKCEVIRESLKQLYDEDIQCIIEEMADKIKKEDIQYKETEKSDSESESDSEED